MTKREQIERDLQNRGAVRKPGLDVNGYRCWMVIESKTVYVGEYPDYLLSQLPRC